MSNYEQEKSQERKRKAAYLEAIFDNTAKKPTSSQDHHNNNDGQLAGREAAGKRNDPPSNAQESAMANNTATEATSMAVSAHRASSHEFLRPPQVTRSAPNHSNPEPPKAREKGPSTSELGGNQFAGFQTRTIAAETNEKAPTKESRAGEIKVAASLNNGVKVKQEQTGEGETLPVQLGSVEGRHEEKTKPGGGEGDGDVGDDYFKYLLFAGKLYHCERVSDLTHNCTRFGTDSLHGRKGDDVIKA